MQGIPGQHIEKQIGNYTFNFVNFLGSGSFSQVFLGKDLRTDNQVAIKIIQQQRLVDQYNKELFLNEISVMQKLDTEHLVQILDVVYTQNNAYIIQEYCDQGDLEKLLFKRKFFQEEHARRIISDIILGQIEMLKANIIHRDLKLANIFINQGKFKIGFFFILGDFGFALKLKSLNQILQTELVGTPIYMSPQVMQKQCYTIKTDIWYYFQNRSLGIMLYELLYGVTPWPARTQQELLYNIYKNTINFPKHIQSILQQAQYPKSQKILLCDVCTLMKTIEFPGIKFQFIHFL